MEDNNWHQFMHDKGSANEVTQNLALATESILIAISRTKNKDGLYELKRISPEKCYEAVKCLYDNLYKESA